MGLFEYLRAQIARITGRDPELHGESSGLYKFYSATDAKTPGLPAIGDKPFKNFAISPVQGTPGMYYDPAGAIRYEFDATGTPTGLWGRVRVGMIAAITAAPTITAAPASGKEWMLVACALSTNETTPRDIEVKVTNTLDTGSKILLFSQAAMASTDTRMWPHGTLNAYTNPGYQGILMTSTDTLSLVAAAVTAAKYYDLVYWYQERNVV